MGMFDDIADASSTMGGAYIVPGKSRFKITALKENHGFKGKCFVAEMEVVTTDIDGWKPGKGVGDVYNITKHGLMALGNVKAFIAALAGIDEDDVTPELCDEAVSDAQPFVGWLVDCEAYNKPTNEGKDFTRKNWTHVQQGPVGEGKDIDVPF